MISRLQDLVSRNRRKLIITGAVIGGTYFAVKYAQRRFIEYQEQQAREFVEKTRRIQHFESTERTCNQVIFGMAFELTQAIINECDTDQLVAQLRKHPANKVDLWEELKIVTFTRLTALIYSSAMLVIALRVQINLIGGYVYRDIVKNQKRISDELKQQYLSLICNFLRDGGLQKLVKLIRARVATIMSKISLAKRLTLADLEQIFWSLQMSINGQKSHDDPITQMWKYLLPLQLPDYSSAGPMLDAMYNETIDLLESDDAAQVCTNNICRGFSLAIDAIAEKMAESSAFHATGTELPPSMIKMPAGVNDVNTKVGVGIDLRRVSLKGEQQIVPIMQNDIEINSAQLHGSSSDSTITNSESSQDSTDSDVTIQQHQLQQQQQQQLQQQQPQQQLQQQQQYSYNSPLININTVEIPLAKIIPIISGLTAELFDPATKPQNLPTALMTFFLVAEKSKLLGANVYETFCSAEGLW